jgi:hypothetical protein
MTNEKPAAKPSRLLLVDFENTNVFNINDVATNIRIIIFLGAHQKTLPVDFVKKCQPRGTSLEWLNLPYTGKNALDFFIAYHLGRILEKYGKNTECFIFSKDHGYDPLIQNLKKEGMSCRRIENIAAIKAQPPQNKK